MFLMNEKMARELRGKVVEKIERKDDRVRITFTDGTAVEIGGDRPQYGRLMVYYRTEKDDVGNRK